MNLPHIGLSTVLLLLAYGIAGTAVAGSFWDRPVPEIELMPGMQTQWVGQDIRYNGVRAGVRTFRVSASATDVIHWYEESWKDADGPVHKRRSKDGSVVLATEDRGYFYSLQVIEGQDGSAEGFLTVSLSPRNAKVSRTTDFPVMPSATVLSRVESFDPVQTAETLVIAAPAAPSTTKEWYRNELTARGWRGSNTFPNSATADHGLDFLQYTNGSRRCDIALLPAASTSRLETALIVNCVR